MRLARSVVFLVCLVGGSPAAAQVPETGDGPPPTIASRVAGLTRVEGFIPLFWDARRGRLLMEIARFDTELLYQVSLPAGLGSNPVGLDRGQLGTRGHRRLRAGRPEGAAHRSRTTASARSSGNAAERRAVDGFLRIVGVVGVQGRGRGRRARARRCHGVLRARRARRRRRACARRSRAASASTRAAARSYLPRTKGFPKNTEVEVDADVHHRRRARRARGAGGGALSRRP